DRQEVLRQGLFEEPKPLRQQYKEIPVDLEIIVLKCVEKNPNDRYATAQEVADDLRRFLEDKPIQAKRPSLRQRFGKWRQRHSGLVRVGMVGLVLVAAVALLSTFLIWQEKQRTGDALARELNRIKEVQRQSERAEVNYNMAREAIK